MLYLGYIYTLDKKITANVEKGIEYLTVAANFNNSDAKCLLGEIYLKGLVVQKDMKKSIHFFKNSADINYNKLAQYKLGLIYYEQEDFNKALFYLENVSNQNLFRNGI